MNKNELLLTLKSDLNEYSSMTFWSWNNELDIPELIKQIHAFKKAGVDAFIIHARTGLVTEYLGEHWFACVEACLIEAKRLNMNVWIYDENGWPSGFVGGKLLEQRENLAQYLEYEKKSFFDESADAVFVLRKDEGVVLLSSALSARENEHEFHNIFIRTDASNVDVLNPAVVTQFLELTHEQYFARFESSFGCELAGFFTDEPQYFRYATPFSPILQSEFKKAYNENLMDGLLFLFLDCEEGFSFRHKFFSLLNNLLTHNFFKRIFDWCEEHNCKLTGHSVEETRLNTQMWCCAGVMPSYEFQHVPGIDWLGRDIDCAISPRQVGSVAQQLGRSRVLSEMFACSGWDTTPRELRYIAEFQYVNGVNAMCQHLSSYSLKGHGKNDYPPSFSSHTAWHRDFRSFNEYFNRLGFVLSNTRELANVLVIHPMHSAYLTFHRERDGESTKALDDSLVELVSTLSNRGICFHFGDEHIMKEHASVHSDKIRIGLCEYDTVVLPKILSIDKSTATLLETYARNGGKLVRVDCDAPEFVDGMRQNLDFLHPNMELEQIKSKVRFAGKNRNIMSTHRQSEKYGEFHFVFNASKTDRVVATFPSSVRLLDLEKCSFGEIQKKITIAPMQSALVRIETEIETEETILVAPKKRRIRKSVSSQFALSFMTQNNLNIDFVAVSFDGVHYDEKGYVYAINEKLIKEGFKGKIFLKYTFNNRNFTEKATCLFEKMRFESIEFNGEAVEVRQSDFDVFFVEADLALLRGENELVLCVYYVQKPIVKHALYDPNVHESVKNCIVIDTEIESVHIQGNFHVDKNRRLSNSAVKARWNLQKKGLPFFSGTVEFCGELDFDSFENVQIHLGGRFMSANVFVNDKFAGEIVLKKQLDLTKFLRVGKNKITLSVTSSMRNKMGPHHYANEPEPHAVGPFMFNMFGSWDGMQSKHFDENYSFVPFGLQKIALLGDFVLAEKVSESKN